MTSTKVKKSPEFLSLVSEIRRQGFDPTILHHIREFDLKHPDSFSTLTPEEWRR